MLMLQRILSAQQAEDDFGQFDEFDDEDVCGRQMVVLPLTTTFVLDAATQEQLDAQAVGVLATRFAEGVVPARLRPLVTTGDGNCFLHAVSKYIWGSELYHEVLRRLLLKEVLTYKSFYIGSVVSAHMQVYKEDQDLQDPAVRQKRTEELYCDLVKSCKGHTRMRNWAGFDEIFVLANALRRPIILYAAKNDVETHGESLVGAGGAFLPLRHKPEECNSRSPVLISWSNLGLHFCPVVRVAGWDSSRFAFPFVRPVICKVSPEGTAPAAAAAGDPPAAADEETKMLEEFQVMERYVDYWEKLQDPPVERNWIDELVAFTIPGFARTRNPADGVEYDIVIPVDLGKSVEYIAFNLGEAIVPKLDAFSVRHRLNRLQLQTILLYIQKTTKKLRWTYRQKKRLTAATAMTEQEGAAGPSACVKLSDFVPKTVQPSLPCVTPEAPDLAMSLDVFPTVPLRTPRLIDHPLSCRATEEFFNNVAQMPGDQKNAYMEIFYSCIFKVEEMLKPGPVGPHEFPFMDFDDTDIELVWTLALRSHNNYTHYEILRYLALVPKAGQFLGHTLVSWCQRPSDDADFCVHLAFVQMLANVLGNQGVVAFTDYGDVLQQLTESRAFTEYLVKVSQSRSPDLLTAFSVLLLNLAVASDFSPMNTLVARLYPCVLATALQQGCVPLLRNVLVGLATLMHNDAAATALLATCPPLERLLASAEALDPQSAPYACFCSSLVQMAHGCV